MTTNNKEVEKIIAIAKKLHLTSEDLAIEAACVDEYGEWEHMSLLGYSAEDLVNAADTLAKAEEEK